MKCVDHNGVSCEDCPYREDPCQVYTEVKRLEKLCGDLGLCLCDIMEQDGRMGDEETDRLLDVVGDYMKHREKEVEDEQDE